jgi:hypothetical protein
MFGVKYYSEDCRLGRVVGLGECDMYFYIYEVGTWFSITITSLAVAARKSLSWETITTVPGG